MLGKATRKHFGRDASGAWRQDRNDWSAAITKESKGFLWLMNRRVRAKLVALDD